MNGGVLKEPVNTPLMVSVPREELETLLASFAQVRKGYLLCAPRYAAGSRGEALVIMANESGKLIEVMHQHLNPPKPDPSAKR